MEWQAKEQWSFSPSEIIIWHWKQTKEYHLCGTIMHEVCSQSPYTCQRACVWISQSEIL